MTYACRPTFPRPTTRSGNIVLEEKISLLTVSIETTSQHVNSPRETHGGAGGASSVGNGAVP